jgi:methyl-accepting chemotaxis protein
MNSTVNTFDKMVHMQQNILNKMKDIAYCMRDLENKGYNIKELMHDLEKNNVSNYDSIADISSSIQELSATSNEIVQYIENVDTKATQLAAMEHN